MARYHIPVLLESSVDLLKIEKDGVYIDVTFGGGGHTKEILKRLEGGRVIAFDRDPDARQNLPEDERVELVESDFTFIESVLEEREVEGVAGILADLGISSHQIDTPNRGFSYRFDAPLDMRMDQAQDITAADILNDWEEADLIRLFSHYGEVPNAKKLARVIAERRKGEPIGKTMQFESMIQSCIPKGRHAKYLAQVYQALRIEVNQELQALESLLTASLKLLKPGGRLVVIAYHSLEDRMVKRFLRAGNLAGLITRRAIQADEEEIVNNSRARSARLRAGEKIKEVVRD
ncbi:UNVERIFIED_CONTAM: hypothetical protein GTU68_024521 [Idotea baltica]|nr:hypothetical protein [Idotea baltica]